VKLAGRETATEREQKPEGSWLERHKATKLAAMLAGRPCPVLENKVAVYHQTTSKIHPSML
ncbi:hypothetical protein A2U01_0094701, partial [Trifolium medium]|nr:hypothetical protein [Trifolium medium]